MEDAWNALMGFISNLIIFALAFLGTWVAWYRDAQYKLKMTAAKECLLAFYALKDSYETALRGPKIVYELTGGKSQTKQQALEKQDKLAADTITNYTKFTMKLHEASLILKMQQFDMRRNPRVALPILEHIETMLKDARYVRDVGYAAVPAADKLEYESTAERLGREMRPEDVGVDYKNFMARVRDSLTDILVPYIEPSPLHLWLAWLSFSRP